MKRENLSSKYKLTEIQSKAIVEMRLRQLTGLEQSKLREEFNELKQTILDLKDILSNKDRRMEIIKTELLDVKRNMETKDDLKFNMLVVISVKKT